MAIYTVLFLSACGKSQFEEVWDNRLSSCGLNCHEPGGVAEDGPDMSTQDKFYANVVGKSVAADYSGWEKTSTCDSLKLIESGNASSSSLVASLVKTVSDAQTCNTAFSYHAGEQVTNESATMSDLVEWINDGASKD